MHVLLRSSCVGAIALAAACSPAPRAGGPASPVTSVSTLVPLQAQPDLSPVSEPTNVVAIARIRNLQSSLASVQRLAKLPALDLSQLFRSLSGQDRLALFKLEASFDLALALDPKSSDDDPGFLAAVSIPVRALEETRVALASSFVPVAPGVYRGVLIDRDSPTNKPTHCDLSVAVGEAPARLVCSDSDRDLDALRPWLVRGLPLQPPASSDLSVLVRGRPFQQRFLAPLERTCDEWAEEARETLQHEFGVHEEELLAVPAAVLRSVYSFASEIDGMEFHTALDPSPPQVRLRSSLAFRSAESWFTRALTNRNDRQGVPPPLFWRAPRDSTAVVYSRGTDQSLYEGIIRTTRLIVSALLSRGNVKAATRTAVEDFLSWTPNPEVVTVSAWGTPPAAPRKKTGKKPRPADAIAEFRSVIDRMLGWTLIGLETPAEPYLAWTRKGTSALSLLLEELRAQIPNTADQAWIPRLKLVAAPPGYPKNSLAVDVSVPFSSRVAWSFLPGLDGEEHPAGPEIKATMTVRLVVVPDGKNRTWIGVSTNLEGLRARVAAALEGAPGTETIATLPGLEPLRTLQGSSAGFISYGKEFDRWIGIAEQENSEDVKEARAVFQAAPHRWEAPILTVGKGTTGSSPTASLDVIVGQDTIDDLVASILYALQKDLFKGALEGSERPLGGPGGILRSSPPPPPTPVP